MKNTLFVLSVLMLSMTISFSADARRYPTPDGGGSAQVPEVPSPPSPFASDAARDTYYTANPAELRNNPRSVYTVVEVTGGSTFRWSGADQPSSYDSNRWQVLAAENSPEMIKTLYESNTNTNAFTDADDGAVASIMNLQSGTYPVAGANGLENGLIISDTTNMETVITGGLAASGGGAFRLRPNFDLQNGGATIRFNELGEGRSFHPVLSEITSAGNAQPFIYRHGQTFNLPATADGSELRSGKTIQFKFDNTAIPNVEQSGEGAVTEYNIPLPASVTDTYTNCNYILTVSSYDNENQLYNFIENSVNGQGFTLSPGDNIIDLDELAAPIFFPSREVFNQITCDQPSITLGGQTLPFGVGGIDEWVLEFDRNEVQFADVEPLAYLSDTGNQDHPVTLRRDMPTAADPWEISTSPFDASSFVLASGVVNLLDTEIQDASQITTELNGVTVSKGDAFVVNTGGEWGQYTGSSEIPDHSILMALVDGPSILDVDTNTDWFLFTEGLLNTKATALLNNFEQDGIKFTGSRNIRIDPSNVAELTNMSSGVPVTRELGTNTQGANRRQSYANTAIQFSDLIGGSLTVTLRIDVARVTGFSPAFTAFELDYPGGFKFTFPLSRVDGDGSLLTSTIQIPNADYSAMLNQNPTLQSLYYDFFGALFVGEYEVLSIINTSVGELNQPVAFVASQQADVVRQELRGDISRLSDEVDADGSALNALTPRISNIRSETVSTPDVNARFLDSTGSDAFPSTIASMNQVSAANPRFTGGNTALYVAAEGGAVYRLNNITKSTSIPLDDSEATIELGESLTEGGTTYFVYRVTGLTSGEVYEVDRITSENVYAWPTDINRNKQEIARIDTELEHAILNLGDDVINVFENEITVTEESNPVTSASDYNKGLAGGSSQTVFYEPNENAGSGGFRTSQPIKDNTGDQARRKLIYFAQGQTFANQAYVHAFDGTTTRDLIRYTNGVFNAQVFVPAIPAGPTTNTIYPAPPNKVSGKDIWIRVPSIVFINGIPTQEANEVFFTRNIPPQSSTLNISYRGHANGNVFGTSSTTLAGVGGSSEVATSFTLNDGSEQAFVEVRYYPSTRRIRVSVTERVNSGLPTINDIEVILSYDETRNVPATPATIREVEIDRAGGRPYVFAIKPSASGNLMLVGREREIDTGYAYTTLFGATEDGHLTAVNEASRFLNYEDFEPIASTVLDLENHASLPQFGLFTTSYTRETDLNIGVTIKPTGLNVDDLPTSATGLSSGDVWFNGTALQFVP